MATVVGVVYLVVGLLGFTVTVGVAFVATDNEALLLGAFQVNPLQNILHLVVGALMIAVGFGQARTARRINSVAGALLLLLGLVGLYVVGTESNLLALNGADNALHFGTAVVLLAAGLGAEKQFSGSA
ncbi:sulfite exporter TauE/SafE [Conyzicola lurida]|uniref:Sulfite exporter TauE/SafE n=1 Tax=Conyzicola lurida TaxID=1172621 RepID=A0A841AP78_9MICO|nr:sulfite exporter TauE/SafE [Conyzicola lurida]